MRCSDETRVLIEYVLIGDVQRFAAPQIMIGHLRRFVAIDGFTEEDVAAFDEAPRRRIVAITGQEIVIEFPKDVQRHTPVRGQYVVVGFPPHGVEIVQRQVALEQFVREPVHVQQSVQFLLIQINANSLQSVSKGRFYCDALGV